MDLFANQSRGYENVRFTLKDLYNSLNAEWQYMIIDTDSESALAYLNAKADMDPDFFCKDVLAFDSTYKTNEYGKPLLIFLGVSNHYSTIFFGCALLVDETIETYTWVLETFLGAMNNKKHVSVITGGDNAMRKAIKNVFHEAHHQLCIWHLQRNAQSNIHNANFMKVFNDCMLNMRTPEDFDQLWRGMVDELGLQDNEWVNKSYSKRERWAETFLRGNFFARMRSTQCCERMNAYMSRFLQRKLKLFELVRQVDQALTRLRNTELKHDFESKHSETVITTHLQSLEKHVASIFTKIFFEMIRDEICKEASLIVSSHVVLLEMHVYKLKKFQTEQEWTVVYYIKDGHFKCSCQEFKSSDIPYCHLFSVMKYKQFAKIPASLILKRWTKDMRLDARALFTSDNHSKDDLRMVRRGSLSADCNEICYYGSMTEAGYWKLKDKLAQLKNEIKEFCINSEETEDDLSMEKKNAKLLKIL